MKKIAISFIGTGNYINFFPKYYETINSYFVPECSKHFFVFTDAEFEGEVSNNISVLNIKENFVPNSSDYRPSNWYNLMGNTVGGIGRFDAIKQIKSELKKYDWYVFIDADYYCCENIITYEDFFNDEKKFFGVQHPTFCPQWKYFSGDLPFERNSNSLSYVKDSEIDGIYLQGCLWGGKIPDVFELIDELDYRIKEDTKKNIKARAHDESHLNRYRIDYLNDFHVLSPSFAKPGLIPDNEFSFTAKMIHSPSDRYQILGAT